MVVKVQGFPVVNWMWYISFATWTAEATYITWTKYLTQNSGEDTVQFGANVYGFELSSFGRSIGSLITIGVGLRAIAILLLWRKSKYN
jgi:hypothetical protein